MSDRAAPSASEVRQVFLDSYSSVAAPFKGDASALCKSSTMTVFSPGLSQGAGQ